jgi:cytochrome c oxidase assembly factor CtaG/cytochrome c2
MQPRLIPRVAIRLATRLVTVAAGLAAIAGPHHAHTGAPPAPHDLWSAWTRDPVILLPLLLSAVIYAVGSRRLRRHAGRGRPGRGLSGLEAAAFWTGWTTLAVALASPLHALGSALFSAHMAQHELMVTLAAPLLVLGRPAIVAVWALPRSWRGHVRVVTAPAVARRAWRTLTAAGLATLLHAVALWGWHLPALYRATLRSELAHGLQHTSFLGTALLFWGALLAPRARRAQAGAGVAWLFLTGLHTVALGTLLAISTRLWVPEYAATTAPWGLMPLEDQQLAGLLMWVPGSTSYLVAALWLFSSWLSASDARVRRRRALAGALPVVVIAVLAAGCHPDDSRVSAADAAAMTGGDAARGRRLIRTYGCGECHTVPGVPGADALVGPELTHTGRRVYIAGSLPNSPANLVRFIQHPRQVDSLTAMPELGVRDQEARDMAAYIYTLH